MAKEPRKPKKSADNPDLPKYSIAVASDLSGVPQQQLRRMEDAGLVTPARTDGNTRRYSDHDLERIDEVNDLANEGINSAGIQHILALQDDLRQLRSDNEELSRQIEQLQQDAQDEDAAKTTAIEQPDIARDSSASHNGTKGAHRRK